MQALYSNIISKPLDYLQTTLLKNVSELSEDAFSSAFMPKGKSKAVGFWPYMVCVQGAVLICVWLAVMVSQMQKKRKKKKMQKNN